MKRIIYFVAAAVSFIASVQGEEETLSSFSRGQELEREKLERGLRKEAILEEERRPLASGEKSLFFMSYHVGGIIPTFGIGGRYQKKQLGFDLSLDLSTLLFINEFHPKATFLYFFPNENFDKQWFTGVGAGLAGVYELDENFSFAVPHLVLGKKRGRTAYYQFEVPIVISEEVIMPGLSFLFGWGF
jgi:hypothetical protein